MRIRCSSCGELHELSDMHVGHERPDPWFAVRPDERDGRWKIGSDLAVLDGERFFIRGVAEIPVHGEAQPYAWGVWAAVSEEDFRRYEAVFEVEARGGEPPFAGRMANQLPGYPQTLGLAVAVRPRAGLQRPAFTVDDAAHPLAVEQREGVYVERVLEMVSPALHGNGPEPRGAPRFATLEEDRWRVWDAIDAWAERRGVTWFPDEETRASVPIGAIAKLLWEIVASDEAGEADTHMERMWVHVDHREGEGDELLYSGTLANDPFNPGLTRFGTRVWFTPRHVVDVRAAEGQEPASAGAELRCGVHGPSFATRVCGHLFREQGRGFHTSGETDTPRPDAWCDACEAVRLREGGWTAAAEELAGITVACGTCYDIIEENNRRG
jgi:hypothetical protein